MAGRARGGTLPHVTSHGQPVQFAVDYSDRPLNRFTTFFRVVTALPIAIVLTSRSGGGIPAAIAGTSKLWLGPVPKPRGIHVSFLAPVRVTDLPDARDALTELIDGEVWPAVQREYGRLQVTPGVIVTALAALGLGGALVARRQRRDAATPRLLGVVAPRRVRPEERTLAAPGTPA